MNQIGASRAQGNHLLEGVDLGVINTDNKRWTNYDRREGADWCGGDARAGRGR